MRILVLAATTGYQTRSFGDAAERLGVELVFATDRCHLLEDPWQDHAIAIRFHDEDASVAAVLESARLHPIDGVLAVGDRPTVIAARVAAALGLPWHPTEGATAARHKRLTRERLRAAGLPVPWWVQTSVNAPASALNDLLATVGGPTFPCVVKPVSLSGSRGVIRADDGASLAAAFERLRALMRSPEVRAERDAAHEIALVEGFIPGREYAIEGLMHHGTLQVLAIFDKPEPLDGPFFEETTYVTPSSASEADQARIVEGVTRAVHAIGLYHGPVHAECRVPSTSSGQAPEVYVLEAAARPIGGLCARALRFMPPDPSSRPSASSAEPPRLRSSPTHRATAGPSEAPKARRRAVPSPLEELLLRQALGEDVRGWRRESDASGVMMIPIPRRGIYRDVEGVDAARRVDGIDDVRITAKADQLLVPLPEGASYLGFIFARRPSVQLVAETLRDAHARLSFTIDPEFPVLTAAQIHYNLQHG